MSRLCEVFCLLPFCSEEQDGGLFPEVSLVSRQAPKAQEGQKSFLQSFLV